MRGSLGRSFDGTIGREIAGKFAKDLERLRSLAEREVPS